MLTSSYINDHLTDRVQYIRLLLCLHSCSQCTAQIYSTTTGSCHLPTVLTVLQWLVECVSGVEALVDEFVKWFGKNQRQSMSTPGQDLDVMEGTQVRPHQQQAEGDKWSLFPKKTEILQKPTHTTHKICFLSCIHALRGLYILGFKVIAYWLILLNTLSELVFYSHI